MKPYRGPPMTLGNAATARVRFIVWCRDCGHQVEPDPAAMPNATAPRRRCRSGASAWSARTRSNAKRAAEKMITDGTAPAIDYGIKPREDRRFEIKWKTNPAPATEAELTAFTETATGDGEPMP